MHFSIFAILQIFVYIAFVFANTEKVIFVAPNHSPRNPIQDKSFIATLDPKQPLVRTAIPVAFGEGQLSWILLKDLDPGARYEVRICWASSAPTDFSLRTLSINHTSLPASLISGVDQNDDTLTHDSALVLKIHGLATYHTNNATLMQIPEPVLVDLILDKYLLGVLPESLTVIAAMITVVAVSAWFAGLFLTEWISREIPKSFVKTKST